MFCIAFDLDDLEGLFSKEIPKCTQCKEKHHIMHTSCHRTGICE